MISALVTILLLSEPSPPVQRAPRPAASAPAAAAAPAPAARKPQAKPEAPRTGEPPRAVQRFVFDPDAVEGDMKRPDEEVVLGGARSPRHRSLIEIPASFTGALLKSMEDL